MENQAERQADIRRLGELLRGIKIAMLTTIEQDGKLHTRPMATQVAEFTGDLWFFTREDTPKVDEVRRHDQVSVSYASPDTNRYISVTGIAYPVRDRKKIEELWGPVYKTWFPQGPADPHLILLRVEVEQAEYWESPSTMAARLVGFVKSLATGQPSQGEHQKLDLGARPPADAT